MDIVDSNTISFNYEKCFRNKVIKGVLIIDNIPDNIEFVDCTFEDKLIIGNNLQDIVIRFTRCGLTQIEVSGKTDWLCLHNCLFKLLHQKPNSEIGNLSISASKETYKIGSIVFENAKTGHFDIRSIVFDKIEVTNHYFKDFKITMCKIIGSFKSENTEYQSAFISFSQFSSVSVVSIKNSEIRFDNVSSTFFSMVKKNLNSKFFLNHIEINMFDFFDFENIDSLVCLEDVKIKNLFRIVNSNLGKLKLIDCKFESSRLETSLSILTDVYSIHTNWPVDIFYYELANWATDERRFLEKMEFWRQLKVNAITQKNQFNALHFYMREMEVKYVSCKSLTQKGEKSKVGKIAFWLVNPIIDLFDIIYSCIRKTNAEGIMLWWHKYTSSFGIDWFRPTIIYFVLSYFFFFVINDYSFTLSFEFDILKDPKFYSFLVPVKSFDGETYLKASVSLAASIFQALLIYQIIQGFRKYSFKS